jgi:hypothetical protein
MTMRSGFLPGVHPVRRQVGRWEDARRLVGGGGQDGWFGLRWMIWLPQSFQPIAGLVVGRYCMLVYLLFVNNVSKVYRRSR